MRANSTTSFLSLARQDNRLLYKVSTYSYDLRLNYEDHKLNSFEFTARRHMISPLGSYLRVFLTCKSPSYGWVGSCPSHSGGGWRALYCPEVGGLQCDKRQFALVIPQLLHSSYRSCEQGNELHGIDARRIHEAG